MNNMHLSRRALLAGTAAASAVGFSASPARSEVQWKKYAGTKLEVILAKGPRGDNLQKHIKEFIDLTGIQVESSKSRSSNSGRMRDRARVGQTELRCRALELSRAEAAVRKGRLARRHHAVHGRTRT